MRQRPRIGRTTAVTGVLLSLLGAGPAFANGAFPAVSQLVPDPAAPDHLILRATFGLLTSQDAGTTWDWLCEQGMGYADLEPPMAVMPGGAILLAIPNGVSRSDPSGCDFRLADGIDANVVDLARVPAEPGSAIAVSLAGTVSQVWRSTDDGQSFSTLGDPLTGLLAATIDSAASNAKVIYVSGIASTAGVLLRSSDAGTSFETFPVPNTTTGRRPYIAAVDPLDENTVYVRLIGVQGLLEVTRNGGKTFTTLLETAAPLQGFALSPDGATVLASNSYDGTFRASSTDLTFEKVACDGRSCLSWNETGLFGCGDDMVDGFIVGRSDDRGTTFQRSVDLSCVRGPLACDPSTSVGAVCPGAWPPVQMQIGATECMPRDVPPYTGCFPSGAGGEAEGTGASSAAGGSSATGAGRGGTAGSPSAGGEAASTSGCGCRVGGGRVEESALGLLVGAGWFARRRRKSHQRPRRK